MPPARRRVQARPAQPQRPPRVPHTSLTAPVGNDFYNTFMETRLLIYLPIVANIPNNVLNALRGMGENRQQDASAGFLYRYNGTGAAERTVTIYHGTLGDNRYVNQGGFAATFFYLALDINDIALPLSHNHANWVKRLPDRTVENVPNTDIAFLFFAMAQHDDGDDLGVYRIERAGGVGGAPGAYLADAQRFPNFTNHVVNLAHPPQPR